ncbi:MAG: glutamate 5-kinase [Propionibacteriaceae bacterium]|nr:glutamate 5-kinase [Propionibacteriaceae bacterium]
MNQLSPEARLRAEIAVARRVVVKVGSSSLATVERGLDPDRLRGLVAALAARQLAGSEVVVVSSGAIAAGLGPLGFTRRPADLAQMQAAAAVGQGKLLSAYTTEFAAFGLHVGQVLLTVGDFSRKASYANALNTFGALTRLGVVPVVNENDTVATQEITFGDNDRLAALVAELVRANVLVLLSDVDGLHTARPGDPGAERIAYVADLGALSPDVSRPGKSGVGSGGMASKVKAAKVAVEAGIPVALARWDQAAAVLAGEPVGTVFAASLKRRSRRHGWLADASFARGQLHVDHGAARALTSTPASLLAAGIRRVEGAFVAGDAVEIVGPDGTVVARGLVAFDAADLPPMLGRGTADLAATLGARFAREVVHRDDLVLRTTGA